MNVEDIIEIDDGSVAIRFEGGIKKAETRTLQIDNKTGSRIAEYIKDSGLKLKDPLFKGQRGTPRLTRQGVWLVLTSSGKRIGIENLTPRTLRDTFMANFTGTPRELSEVLGRKR